MLCFSIESQRGTVRVICQPPRSGSTVVKGCGRSTLERGSSLKNLGAVKSYGSPPVTMSRRPYAGAYCKWRTAEPKDRRTLRHYRFWGVAAPALGCLPPYFLL
ncbi:unnamed protein product [Rangifer tarandus platyrhynchus]|uniref:Uncharacterized protein n=1 Tax=Rangifer tarandus platyrhynchus TaxID=3082113 RepID=A0ABN8Z716_RANTA|nr:unnamed protein product [Rangifer tarandus platyrhynchus]